MNELQYEARTGLERTGSLPKKREKRRTPLWLRVTSVLLIWAIVALGCFLLARFYIEDIQSQLDRMAANNAQETALLNEKLSGLQTALDAHKQSAEALETQLAAVVGELNAVKEEMALAGSSLSATAETKQALSDRINDLSNELTELRKLIKQLEEAARVY